MKERSILDKDGIQRALVRIAHEILEHNHGTKDLVLVGLRTRGVFLAERIQKEIQKIENVQLPMGVLDITLYRDDLDEKSTLPTVRETNIPCSIRGKVVVLVDDVLFSGRSIRAALDAIIDFGRPKAIQLAVMIDRGHRELPIKADYVGKNIPTSKDEEVVLRLTDPDGNDEAVVTEKASGGRP